MNGSIKLITGGLVFFILLWSCTNHDLEDPSLANTSDESLFAEVDAGGFTYYEGGTMFPAASPSPHSSFRLRFNSIAQQALNNNGELDQNGSFPIGSVIVKEGYLNQTFNSYAVMKKSPTDPNAVNGWLWGGYLIDGQTTISITEKGSHCVDCHSGTPNRDLVRTFDLH
jgi:hypothetical protein